MKHPDTANPKPPVTEWLLYWRGSVTDLATDLRALLFGEQLRALCRKIEEQP